ncbi:spore photoproduct lyase [Bacillota bacterium LX-D]|nr:spore photoproduct lyase [Bacillota bacterium LX-D]
MQFKPKRVFFEEKALDYELGQNLYNYFKNDQVELKIIKSHNRISGIPGKTPQQSYNEAKRTLVVGVRKGDNFQTCKPSAHFQLPLVTSCPGKCEYCYLQTTLGKKPYIRVYVNVEEILQRAEEYIQERKPEITIFEGAATSDPIPVEYLTGSLARTINFFGQQELGLFRFVTKFTDVDSLLNLKHQGKTTFRFSINSSYVINNFEHGTPALIDRLEAAAKVAHAGYPLGFIIGPILEYSNWEEEYSKMLNSLHNYLTDIPKKITFELITHRFTSRAKNNILSLFPESKLPLNEEERQLKYGQFGYTKYLYPKDKLAQMQVFFNDQLKKYFPQADIAYFV